MRRGAGPERRSVRVWDAPTRLFHWLLALLVAAMWVTGEERAISVHTQIGVALFGLVVFRVLWGFVGSETARFARFLKGPSTVWAYLRGRYVHGLGHNPLGGWSVAALLLVLLAQCALGLVAQDVDGMEFGPLSHLVSYETSEAARIWHHRLFDALLILVGLHLLAILWYFLGRGEDLVTPMLNGRTQVPADTPEPRAGSKTAFAGAAVAAVALALWVGAGAPLPAPFTP